MNCTDLKFNKILLLRRLVRLDGCVNRTLDLLHPSTGFKTPAALTGALQELEKLGLVQRSRSGLDGDTRRVSIAITPAGEKMVEQAQRLLQDGSQ